MNIKNYIVPTIVGTIFYFLLWWLFYGILFTEIHQKENNTSMLLILLGSLFYAVMFNLILEKMEDVTTFKSGFFIALPIGFLLSASMNFLMYSSKTLNLEFFITDVFIGSVSTAIMSGAIGTTLGKVK